MVYKQIPSIHKRDLGIITWSKLSATKTNIYKSRGVPVSFAFFLIFILVGAVFNSPNAYASALYSCGNPNSGHCYGLNYWSGSTNGVRTRIFTNQLSPGDCFVNNEVWLIYAVNGNPEYWVETGFTSDVVNSGQENVFWDDNRPNYGYDMHDGNFLTSSDFGKTSREDIHKIATDQFSVSISGLPITGISGTSTANPINPNLIEIGLEMCGSSFAGAPKNGYSYNQFLDAHSGVWTYQSLNGSPINDSPAYGYWTIYPSQSSTGGQWTTCIIGNGC